MAEIHDRSNRQEHNLAVAVNGQRSARSGAGTKRKADVRSARFLYEAKSTKGKSFTLASDDLKTIRQHAHNAGREAGLMSIELGGREYVVVERSVWIEESGGG